MTGNDWEWLGMTGNDWEWLCEICVGMTGKWLGMTENDWKWLRILAKMTENDWEWLNFLWKWLGMTGNDWEWLGMLSGPSKMDRLCLRLNFPLTCSGTRIFLSVNLSQSQSVFSVYIGNTKVFWNFDSNELRSFETWNVASNDSNRTGVTEIWSRALRQEAPRLRVAGSSGNALNQRVIVSISEWYCIRYKKRRHPSIPAVMAGFVGPTTKALKRQRPLAVPFSLRTWLVANNTGAVPEGLCGVLKAISSEIN